MAFSPPKPTRPQPELRPNYPQDRIEKPPPNIQAPKVAEPPAKITWTQQIQVPGQQNSQQNSKPIELPFLPPLPTIRPVSPLQGGVFGDSTPSGNRKQANENTSLGPSPKREKSPVRQPVVNTFLQQAQQLERQEKGLHSPPPKIGRQLSAASQDVPTRPDKVTTPTESPGDESNAAGKAGFFSHFRKRARKRMSVNGDEIVSPESPMPISPIPQLQPIKVDDDKSLRNSIVMDDFFEDAQDHFEGDLMKEVDEVLSATFRPQHITIVPSPTKAIASHPPSSHKNSATPPIIPAKHTRHVPSPYPTNVVESPPKPPPLTIPKRGSSRKLGADTPDSGTSSRARRQNATSPLPRILDDITTNGALPGAYPLSSSPDIISALDRRPSIPMSRSITNLSVNLPGAYPRERNRYNSSSSGLSSAASYRTAFDPDTWDSEEQKQKEEQAMLQQSLMDATRAMRALEKYTFTDWTERTKGASTTEKYDTVEETTLRDSPIVAAWPTPPYFDDRDDSSTTASSSKRAVKPPPRTDIDYFRIDIPSPSGR
jgi:hypothetical protein